MEEIKVGEYVRTKNGRIFKVKEINEDYLVEDIEYGGLGCFIEYAVKHSFNIIDLIEVGDIVTVEEVDTKWERTVEVDEEGYIKYLKMYVGKEEKLKKILTHEQYEQNCYKLEE